MTVRPRGRETAGRLLDAALAVHEGLGPDGFTVQAVLDRSGVSLGSLYHHFGSVGGLRAALYSRCLGRMLDAVLEDLGQTRTAEEAVRATVLSYLRFTAEHPDAARYVHASSYAAFLPEHGALVMAEQAERVAALLAVFRRHVEAGDVVDLPLPVLEVVVIGPVAELCRRWLTGGYDLSLDAATTQLPDRAWAAVRAR